MTNLALEEEFFAVEGRPEPCASRACLYVSELEHGLAGGRITAEERAALWYLAYWSREGVARVSLAALAMHIDTFRSGAADVLCALVAKGVLKPLPQEELARRHGDAQVYVFAELAQ